MITRIVKMTFREAEADEFGHFVQTIKEQILGFEGCNDLHVYRDVDCPHIFFSYSKWESVDLLNAYRKSEFFRATWQRTKQGFAAKAEAWSVDENF